MYIKSSREKLTLSDTLRVYLLVLTVQACIEKYGNKINFLEYNQHIHIYLPVVIYPLAAQVIAQSNREPDKARRRPNLRRHNYFKI